MPAELGVPLEESQKDIEVEEKVKSSEVTNKGQSAAFGFTPIYFPAAPIAPKLLSAMRFLDTKANFAIGRVFGTFLGQDGKEHSITRSAEW